MAIPDNQIQCQLEKFMSGVQPAHVERTKKLSEESLNQFLLLAINEEKIGEELRQIFYQDFFPPTEDQLEKGKKKLEEAIAKFSNYKEKSLKTPKKSTDILICSNPDCQYPKLTTTMKYCPKCMGEVNPEPEDIDQDNEELVLLKCKCEKFLELDWEVCPYCLEPATSAKTVKEKRGFVGTLQALLNRGNPVYEEVNVVKKNGENDSKTEESIEDPNINSVNAINEPEEEELNDKNHNCNCFSSNAIEEKIENLQNAILEKLQNAPASTDKINKSLDILKDSIIEIAKINAVYEAELAEVKNNSICLLKEVKVIREEQQKAASCFQTLADYVAKKSQISPEKKKKTSTEN